jgi:hypothetical protein
LTIVGPSEDHLLECAQIIRDRTQDAVDRITDMVQQDVELDPVAAYRRLVQQNFDALDGGQRPGAAVNLQSVITRFKVGAHKILLAGDMQFEKPGVGNETVKTSVKDLRQAIADDGPYSFRQAVTSRERQRVFGSDSAGARRHGAVRHLRGGAQREAPECRRCSRC